MSGYGVFAHYYDELTRNVPYDAMAERLDILLRSHTVAPEGVRPVLLDLGCGTGSISERMAMRGYDVIGADASCDMLAIASQKRVANGSDVLYICQDMRKLRLYSPAHACISTLDSFCHCPDKAAVAQAFGRVADCLYEGGLFLFDVNSPFKHAHVLAGNTFVYDSEQVYCVWKNTYSEQDCTVHIDLDLFVRENDRYRLEEESFVERTYALADWEQLLTDAGFTMIEVFDDYTEQEVQEDSQRYLFVARKQGV